MSKPFRYPGAQPFTSAQKSIFFGRDKEIGKLFELITLNKLVVLYSKSGLGKSSLLNAGLIPKIEEEGKALTPIPIRFGASTSSDFPAPLLRVDEILDEESELLNKIRPEGEDSLWYYAKSRQLNQVDDNGLLLIFDQFEELFTYSEKEIKAFKEEIAELLYITIPDRFRENLETRLQEDPNYFSKEELQALHKIIDLRIIMSIRSDRLSLLNRLKEPLGNILDNCFELQPLSTEQAEEAILNPAYDQGDFVTPRFDYTDDAVDRLIQFLSREGEEDIESFQLQILCEYLERNIVIKQQREKITISDINYPERILERYYYDKIEEIEGEENQLAARRLIEEGLIFEEEQRRLSLYEGQINTAYNIGPDLLRQLLDTHLIRSESSMRGGFTYELSHDTLVGPVLKAKAERMSAIMQEQERLAQIEKELAAAKEQAAKERQRAEQESQRRASAEENEEKAQRFSRRAVLFSVLAMLLAVVAGWSYIQATKARELAQRQTQVSLANNLAFRAEDLIEKRDRTSALALSEFVLNAINSDNINAQKALENAFYFNDQMKAEDLWTMGQMWSNSLIGHTEEVNMVIFHPLDDTKLISVSDDGTMRTWDWKTGKELEIINFGKAIYDIDYAADGSLLVLGFLDGEVRVLEGSTNELMRKIPAHKARLSEVVLSPDNKFLATASEDTKVKVWKLENGGLLYEFEDHEQFAEGLAFSKDGNFLVSAGIDHFAMIWDLNTGKLINKIDVAGFALYGVVFSRDGQYVAFSSYDNNIYVFNSIDWTTRFKLEGHEGIVQGIQFSNDNKFFVSASHDLSTRVWSLEDGSEQYKFKGQNGVILSLAFSSDDRFLASGAADNTIRIWDWQPKEEASIFRGYKSPQMLSSVFSSDGEMIATLSSGEVKIHNVKSQEELKSFYANGRIFTDVSFSPENRYLAVASYKAGGIIYDLEKDTAILNLKGHNSGIWGIDFSPDGTKIVTSSLDSTAIIWSFPEATPLLTLKGHNHELRRVNFSNDGTIVATTSSDSTCILWDASTGEELQKLYGHTRRVTDAMFSPNGKYVATSSFDNTARLWDIATGKEIRQFVGHKNFILSLVFSPDGTTLVTSSVDNTIKFWNIESGQEIRSYEGHKNLIYGLDYDPTGKYILSGSYDGTARLWFADYQEFMNAQNFPLHPGKLDPDKILNYEIPSILAIVGPSAEELCQALDPITLKSLGLTYQRKGLEQSELEPANAYFSDAKTYFRSIQDRLPKEVANYYLAKLNGDWAHQLLSFGDYRKADNRIGAALSYSPNDDQLAKTAALIQLAQDNFAIGVGPILRLHLNNKINIQQELNRLKSFDSYSENKTWQANAEKLIRIIEPSAAQKLSPAAAEKYGVENIQFNDLDREMLINAIEDEGIRKELLK